MKDVVSITQALFSLSKVINILPLPADVSFIHIFNHQQETAKLESENYVRQQKITVASELKSVLDSWVRYEQQVKEREQADLTKAVVDKVIASLKDEKVQRDILVNAVAEIERE
jgi:F-type H+-transporting ATPase subunit b